MVYHSRNIHKAHNSNLILLKITDQQLFVLSVRNSDVNADI